MTGFRGKYIEFNQDVPNKCLIILVNSKFLKFCWAHTTHG